MGNAHSCGKKAIIIKFISWRWAFFIVGTLLIALGITLSIKGRMLGISPWDVLHVGLFLHFGVTIGTWSIVAGLTVIIITAFFTKGWPQVGTWLNMVGIGVFIDIFNWLIPEVPNLAGQTVVFVLGVVILGIGIGMYVAPGIGAGPRDTLMLVIVERTGWTVKRVRTLLELTVAMIGWSLGGPVGIGTVIVILLLGQVVHLTVPLAGGWLQKCLEKQRAIAHQ